MTTNSSALHFTTPSPLATLIEVAGQLGFDWLSPDETTLVLLQPDLDGVLGDEVEKDKWMKWRRGNDTT